MTLQAVQSLWKPELANLARDESTPVAPLQIPGWRCTPYEIQTRGVTWLYATPRAVLGDVTGTGKTIHGAGLAQLLFALGEARGRRVIVVCPSSVIGQWCEELARFTSGLTIATNSGLSKAQRRRLYAGQWDVLVTGYRLMWGDKVMLSQLQPALVWFDESSYFRTSDTETAAGARLLMAYAGRAVCADATPIQNTLMDVFSQLEVLGLAGYSGSVFGNEWEFKARHVVEQPVTIYVRGGRRRTEMQVTGYNRLDEFRAQLRPFYLRRTEGSGDMPEVIPEDIPIPMHKEQLEEYRRVALSSAGAGENKLMALQKITAGLGTYGMGIDVSAKLDYIELALERRWFNADGSPAKAVIFSRFLETSRLLAERLARKGIGYGFIDGPRRNERDAVRRAFWEDPNMRVVIGTTAMERGMNLHIARWVCTIDYLTNPARVEQILGRVKRAGSEHSHVFMERLITPGTFEEGVLKTLKIRQELSDTVNDDVSDLFKHFTLEQQQAMLLGEAA